MQRQAGFNQSQQPPQPHPQPSGPPPTKPPLPWKATPLPEIYRQVLMVFQGVSGQYTGTVSKVQFYLAVLSSFLKQNCLLPT